jgi:hypothetical protein
MKRLAIFLIAISLLAGGVSKAADRRVRRVAPRRMAPAVKTKMHVSQEQQALIKAQAWLKEVGYDKTIEQMKAMTWLRLQMYSQKMVKLITDDNMVHLKVLKNLETLALPRQIGDRGLANVAGLTKLTTLNIPMTKLTDAGMVHLKNLTYMRSLVISATSITDAGLVHIANMHHLEILNLSSTNITDAGLAHLANMQYLQKLFLFRCNITDAAIPQLSNFGNLNRLNIQATKITQAGFQQLRARFPNITINY